MMIKIVVLAMSVLMSACGYNGNRKKQQQAPAATDNTDSNASEQHYATWDGSRRFQFTRKGSDEVLIKEETNGEVYLMKRVKTASGERYVADDGYSFWIKGDSFMFLKDEDIILKGQRVEQKGGAVSFKQSLHKEDIEFHLEATKADYHHRLVVRTQGLAARDYNESFDIMGYRVIDALLADLNSDNSPELLIITQSDGSGSYGELLAFSVNNLRSMSQVYVAPIVDHPAAEGYMGHDEFVVEENVLKRRFPVYLPDDANALPTGGTRQITYRLEEGEAMRKLVIANYEDL
ncbi:MULTISPECIES: MliC family protein [unclassified Carboxylicivirga]|uniref:MliC family protein n=1 Tax=Carboxylicivirga TaxID=1628153 RepID=UPI003D359501